MTRHSFARTVLLLPLAACALCTGAAAQAGEAAALLQRAAAQAARSAAAPDGFFRSAAAPAWSTRAGGAQAARGKGGRGRH